MSGLAILHLMNLTGFFISMQAYRLEKEKRLQKMNKMDLLFDGLTSLLLSA